MKTIWVGAISGKETETYFISLKLLQIYEKKRKKKKRTKSSKAKIKRTKKQQQQQIFAVKHKTLPDQ